MTVLQKELWRKSIHFSGIFLIPILLWKRVVFSSLFLAILMIYFFVEELNRRGKCAPLLTSLMTKSKRANEKGRIAQSVLCLCLSGATAPYLLGPMAAAIGLAQLFVADTTASLVGLRFGRKKLPFSKNKSWMGSSAYLVTAILVGLFFLPFHQALLLALLGTLVELLPFPEWDNFTIPFTIGLAVLIFL